MIAPRTIEDVKAALEQAKKNGADQSTARLMLNHGRLTEEARDHLVSEYIYSKDQK
jgi:hypothetical protein